MSEHQRDAIHAARQMTAALNEMSGRLDEAEKQRKRRDEFLTAYGRRNRRLIWFTAVSLLLDVALTIAVTVSLFGIHRNSATITDLHSTSVSACKLGNQTRAQSIALWEHVASVGGSHHESLRQRETVDKFLAYVRRVYAPRNCPSLYRLGQP